MNVWCFFSHFHCVLFPFSAFQKVRKFDAVRFAWIWVDCYRVTDAHTQTCMHRCGDLWSDFPVKKKVWIGKRTTHCHKMMDKNINSKGQMRMWDFWFSFYRRQTPNGDDDKAEKEKREMWNCLFDFIEWCVEDITTFATHNCVDIQKNRKQTNQYQVNLLENIWKNLWNENRTENHMKIEVEDEIFVIIGFDFIFVLSFSLRAFNVRSTISTHFTSIVFLKWFQWIFHLIFSFLAIFFFSSCHHSLSVDNKRSLWHILLR